MPPKRADKRQRDDNPFSDTHSNSESESDWSLEKFNKIFPRYFDTPKQREVIDLDTPPSSPKHDAAHKKGKYTFSQIETIAKASQNNWLSQKLLKEYLPHKYIANKRRQMFISDLLMLSRFLVREPHDDDSDFVALSNQIKIKYPEWASELPLQQIRVRNELRQEFHQHELIRRQDLQDKMAFQNADEIMRETDKKLDNIYGDYSITAREETIERTKLVKDLKEGKITQEEFFDKLGI